MTRLLVALATLLLAFCPPAHADYLIVDGNGKKIVVKSNTCDGSKICPISSLVDATGAAFGVSANPLFVTSITPLSVTLTGGGFTPYHLVAANSNNSISLKQSAGSVASVQLGGIGSVPAYLKFYDKATAPNCGSDPVIGQFIVPANSTPANGGGNNVPIPGGMNFLNGIAFCVVNGIADTDNSPVLAATYIVNFQYK